MLVGVALGVTFPLLAFRWFAPNEIFPITYRQGSGATWMSAAHEGRRSGGASKSSSASSSRRSKPFGLAGSAGSTPLRITVKGDPPTYLFGKLYARSHLRADRWYKLGQELLYGRLEDEAVQHRAPAGQQEDYALALMQRAGL